MGGRFRNMGLVAIGAFAGVAVSLGISAWAFRDSRGPIPLDEIRQFTDVFGVIKANYVEPIEDKKLMQEAISGMLTGLDPHSAFLDGDAFKDLQTATQGEFGGLGIEVGPDESGVKVVAPIDDTPAARAGIRSGDLIIKIDDKLTRGMPLNDAVKLMRGKRGTSVMLTVGRKNETKPLEFKLVRDVIRVQSVKAKMVEPGYGFVRITNFQERTIEDMVARVNELYKQEPLKGLVLDLRNDPGGLLNAAVGVTAAFLPPGTLVVSTDGRNEDSKRKFVAAPQDYQRSRGEDPLVRLTPAARTVPMVVLVNNASASASEIVAGALQDNKRATLIGGQTFGKGSVQTIIPLRSSGDQSAAIKLTTARYYTPSGRSIQAKGIEPDLIVDDTPEGNFGGFTVREADLTHHLQNNTQPEESGKPEAAKSDDDAKAKPSLKRYDFGAAEDFQLQQALNRLQGKPVMTAKPVETIAAKAERK
jgi:carboxyl-terminal processing protease